MTFKDCKNAGSCGKDLCLPEFCHEFDKIQKTNGDIIREMSDEELAKFLANRFANESLNRLSEDNVVTATQIGAITQTWYCCWMDWLQQPAEEVR